MRAKSNLFFLNLIYKPELILSSLFLLLLAISLSVSTVLPMYRDEEVYIECGVKYLYGIPPLECNFEHPPLAKYVIGLLALVDEARISLVLLNLGSAFLMYVICRRIGLDKEAFLCASLFLFDSIVFNTFRFFLLDPFSLFFALLGVYFAVVDKPVYSAVAMGLSISSKLSSLPVLAGLALFYLRRLDLKRLLRYLAVVLLVYVAAFSMDLAIGINGIIRHHVEMYNYMKWRHGFSLPIALNGLLKLVARVEYWVYTRDIYIDLRVVDSTVVVLNETFRDVNGRVLIAYLGAGSPLWHLLLPALLVNTYYVLTRGVHGWRDYLVILSWLSLISILPGPLDWYYVNTLPYLYMNLCILLHRHREHGGLHKIALCTLFSVHLLFFIATLTGLTPFMIKIVYR